MTAPRGASLAEIAREIPGARIVSGAPETRVTDVRHDSRDVGPGDVFVVRKGGREDGARFVPEALERGAAALIAESELSADVPMLKVPNAEIALALAASVVWNHPSFAL